MRPRTLFIAILCVTGCALADSSSTLIEERERTGQVSQPLVNLVIGSPDGAQLGLNVRSDRIAVQELIAGGRSWFTGSGREFFGSPLFEASVPGCIWTSTGVSEPLHMVVSPPSTVGSATQIGVRLTGCAGVPPLDLSLRLQATNGQVQANGFVTNGLLPATSEWGWAGPFVLGDTAQQPLPVFGAEAYIAALRSRVIKLSDLREEMFVVGFDGIVYGSEELNDGAWSVPAPLYSPFLQDNRSVFPPGAPLAAVRRSDHQLDVFAVSAGGANGGAQLMTTFRVDDNAWNPPTFLAPNEGPPLRPGSALAALSIHEETDTRVNEIEVYVASLDGRIYSYRESDDGAWDASVAIDTLPRRPAPFLCRVPTDRPVHIAAITRNHRQRDMFFIDTRGRLCESFKLRTNEQPPDDRNAWARPRAISGPLFVPGAPVAVAHGSGNDEHVFAIDTHGSVCEAHETDDGAWVPPRVIAFGVAASTSSVAAARRSARDVVVSYVDPGGRVFEVRSIENDWSVPAPVPALAGSPARKLALSLRKPEQLDVFSTAGVGDGRLWTSADGFGRVDVRLVLPKLLFPEGALEGARGMIPAEMGTDHVLKAPDCHPDPVYGISNSGCMLGMPYANDPRAQQVGLPQSMNIMEVAHVTKDGASFFVADASPPGIGPIETGRSPTQMIASQAEVSGLWTRELWPGRSARLPFVVFGGYASTDWHPAVDAYTAAHTDDPAPPHVPGWLRNAGAIVSTGGGAGGIYLDLPFMPLLNYAMHDSFPTVLARMLTDARSLGTDVVYLIDYWARTGTCGGDAYFCKGDYRIRPDLAEPGCSDPDCPLKALKKGIADVRGRGGHVILYVEPFIWGLGADTANQYQDLFRARDPNGAPWIAFKDSVTLSYAHSGWQDRFVELTRRLVEETGADGVFLDSGAWRLNERVQTAGETVRASPLEHARAFLDLSDRVRAAIRSVRPEAVVLTETTSGPAVRHVDGGVSADFSPMFSSGAALADGFDGNSNLLGAVLRATPARYAIREANIFGNGKNLNQLNQVYAAGYNLALTPFDFMLTNAPYIQRLVRRRIVHANALVEGTQSDVGVVGIPANVIARRYAPLRRLFSLGRDVITVVNVGESTSAVLDISGVAGFGRTFCDVIARREYTAVGQLLYVDLPAVSEPCTTGDCGLRVLVRERCAIEPP